MKTMKKMSIITSVILCLLAVTSTALATTKYWDINGATAGAGGATPSGAWNTTSNFWNETADGTGIPGVWATGDLAVFSAGTDATGNYTITQSANMQPDSITIQEGGNVRITGSTLTVTTSYDAQNAGSNSIGSVVAGRFTKNGPGMVFIGTGNQQTQTIISNGSVHVSSSTGWGPAPTALSPTNIIIAGTGMLVDTRAGSGSTFLETLRGIQVYDTGAILVNGTSFLYTGRIGGNGTLIKRGAADLRVYATNNYTFTKLVVERGMWTLGQGGFGGHENGMGNPTGPTPDAVTIKSNAQLRFNQTTGIDSRADRGFIMTNGGGIITNLVASPVYIRGNITGPDKCDLGALGSFALMGNNTFQGTCRLAVNAVYIGSDSAFGTGQLDYRVGGLIGTNGAHYVSNYTYLAASSFTSGGTDLTFTGDMNLGTATSPFNITNNVTFLGKLTNGVGGSGIRLEKYRPGKMILMADNTWDSTNMVFGGLVSISADSQLGIAPGTPQTNVVLNGGGIEVRDTLTWNDNRIIELLGAGTISCTNGTLTIGHALTGPGALTLAGAGTIDFGAIANLYTGGTVIAAGHTQTLDVAGNNIPGGAALRVDGTFNLNDVNKSFTTLAGAGTLNIGIADLTIGADTGSNYFSGMLNGAGGVTKIGSNAAGFGGSNSFGALIINSGTVALDITNGNTLCIGDITVDPTNLVVLRTLRSGAANLITNKVILNATANNIVATVRSNSSLTLSGPIEGAGFLLVGDDANAVGYLGSLALTADNTQGATWTGGIELRNGSLLFGDKNAAGFGLITNNPMSSSAALGATADLTGASAVTNGIVFTTNYSLGFAGAYNLELSADMALPASVTLSSATTGGAAGILSGIISGTGFGLTKAGAGIVTLKGANTYDNGTIIDAGTLRVANASGSATGTGGVLATNGGILGGTGTISGDLTLDDGQIAPGASVGTINTANEIWNGGGALNFEVNDATGIAGTDPGWDLVNITGTLAINATAGDKFIINVASLAESVAGECVNFSAGNDYSWTIVQTSGGITGFSEDAFTVNAGSFSNAVDAGVTWKVIVDGNNLKLAYGRKPVITTQPVGATVDAGAANQVFSVVATGTSPLGYFWQKNGTDISGANSDSYTINPVAGTDAANYTVAISNAYGMVTSSVATLAVGINISSNPSGLTRDPGQSAIFSVVADGQATVTYQWMKNGVSIANGGNVSGATTASLTIDPVNGVNFGDYSCGVTNGVNGNASTAAALNVTPDITAQPVGFVTNQSGATVNFAVTATGSATLTYLWHKGSTALADGGIISGATTPSLTLTGIALSDAGNYTCAVTNDFGGVISASGNLYVQDAPVVQTQPTSRTNAAGTAATFTIEVTGGTPMYYTWKKGGVDMFNGGDISGADTASLTIANVEQADAATYTVFVENNDGDLLSDGAILTVIDPPVITTDPATQTAHAGSNVVFNVAYTGTAPGFVWYKGASILPDGGNIAGATTASLTVSSVAQADAADYSVVLSNLANVVTSAVAALTVIDPPTITVDPATQTLAAGSSAIFSVTATGTTPFTYVWKMGVSTLTDGGDISGATTASLTIANLEAADDGSYTVEVSNEAGTDTSAAATLTVLDAPVVTVDPVGATYTAGDNITLTVTATGAATLSYQWKKDGSALIDGGNIAGATTDALTITSATVANAGSYTCVVTNTVGTDESAAAAIVVNQAPAITAQPSSQVITTALQNVTFEATVTGNPLNYQWYKNGAAISGANSASYVLTGPVATSANGYYHVIVTNDLGSVTSDTVMLSRATNVTIFEDDFEAGLGKWTEHAAGTALGSSTEQAKSGTKSAKVTNSGKGMYFNITNYTGGTEISGAMKLEFWLYYSSGTGARAFAGPRAYAGGGYNDGALGQIYAIGVYNSGVDVNYFNGRNLYGGTPSGWLNLNANPPNKTRGVNGWKRMALVREDDATTLKFFYATNADASDLDICQTVTGSTSNTLDCIFMGSVLAGTTAYTEYFDDMKLSYIHTPNVVTTDPANVGTNYGGTAVFTVDVAGKVAAYQWLKDGVELVDGGAISGATTKTLTIAGVANADEGSYTCRVIGEQTPLISAAATLTVADPAITAQPVGLTNAAGSTAVFNVSAAGSALTYQWYKGVNALTDAGNIAGATTASLSISDIYFSDADSYKVEVTSADGTVTSDVVPLVVIDPVITAEPTNTTVNAGVTAQFTVVAAGSSITYQWFKGVTQLANDSKYSGVDSATLSISDALDADEDSYSCVITGTQGVTNSATVTLTVNDPTITTQPLSQTKLVGSTLTLTVAAYGTAPLTYQWFKDAAELVDGGDISGANAATLSVANLEVADAGSYTVIVTNANANIAASTTATLTVADPVSITAQPVGVTNDAGSTIILAVTASGGAPISYHWKKGVDYLVDGGSIIGSATAALTITNALGGDSGQYSCEVSNTVSQANSDTVQVLVNDPVITTQPANQSAGVGGNATFSVVAVGTSLRYQWYATGSPVVGATNDSLTVNNVQVTMNNRQYAVDVISDFATVRSANATLSVVVPVTLTKFPTNDITTVGMTTQFLVAAAGGGTKTYQWYKDGVALVNGGNISGATWTNLTILPTGTNDIATTGYYVVVVNEANSVTSAAVNVTLLADANIPTVKVTYPGKDGSVPAAGPYEVTVSGVAEDKQYVSKVFVSVNGSAAAEATVTRIAPGLKSTWTYVATVVPGTNILTVRSEDFFGNSSLTLSHRFYWDVFSPITFATNGEGGILLKIGTAVVTNGQLLKVGRPYQALAVPGTNGLGWLFTNWSGTTYSITNKYTFLMQTNFVLQANYLSNLFKIAAGKYYGLFIPATGATHESAGHVKITTDSKQMLSGDLYAGGTKVTFKGKMGLDGHVIITNQARWKLGKPELTLDLQLDLSDETKMVTGTVTGPDWTASLVADKETFNKTNNQIPVALRGRYSMVIPPLDGPINAPGGYGYAFFSAISNGIMKVEGGYLGDGTPFKALSLPMSKDYIVPCFVYDMYKGTNVIYTNGIPYKTNNAEYKGSVLGWLTLAPNAGAPLYTNAVAETNYAPLGTLSWIKTGWTNIYYPNGFTNVTPVYSSKQVPSTRTNIVLGKPVYDGRVMTNWVAGTNWSAASVLIAQGGLTGTYTNIGQYNLKSEIVTNSLGMLPTNYKFNMKIDPKTALVTGSFTNPETMTVQKFFGMALQEWNFGAGFFQNPVSAPPQTGYFIINGQ